MGNHRAGFFVRHVEVVLDPPPQIWKEYVRSACNHHRVSGVVISYTSERVYIGPDYVGLEAISSGGSLRHAYYTIYVK